VRRIHRLFIVTNSSQVTQRAANARARQRAFSVGSAPGGRRHATKISPCQTLLQRTLRAHRDRLHPLNQPFREALPIPEAASTSHRMFSPRLRASHGFRKPNGGRNQPASAQQVPDCGIRQAQLNAYFRGRIQNKSDDSV